MESKRRFIQKKREEQQRRQDEEDARLIEDEDGMFQIAKSKKKQKVWKPKVRNHDRQDSPPKEEPKPKKKVKKTKPKPQPEEDKPKKPKGPFVDFLGLQDDGANAEEAKAAPAKKPAKEEKKEAKKQPQ